MNVMNGTGHFFLLPFSMVAMFFLVVGVIGDISAVISGVIIAALRKTAVDIKEGAKVTLEKKKSDKDDVTELIVLKMFTDTLGITKK